MNELALFSGVGGGILGGKLLGWRTVCAVEWDTYAAGVLCARQNDGLLSPFPIWSDIRTFDGVPWRGRVDVVSGGFPCQDLSVAGHGDGLDGERSGLWREMSRIIGEIRPQYAFVENSPNLVNRGLDRVLADLTQMGYDCRWCVMGANSVGAPHKRDRVWIVGKIPDSECVGRTERAIVKRVVRQENQADISSHSHQALCADAPEWWSTEPRVGRVAHGVDARVDRLKAIGNGQVPLCAATAWRILTKDWK
jgi:DNA (cytosine-5)-methyltransferase 1